MVRVTDYGDQRWILTLWLASNDGLSRCGSSGTRICWIAGEEGEGGATVGALPVCSAAYRVYRVVSRVVLLSTLDGLSYSSL